MGRSALRWTNLYSPPLLLPCQATTGSPILLGCCTSGFDSVSHICCEQACAKLAHADSDRGRRASDVSRTAHVQSPDPDTRIIAANSSVDDDPSNLSFLPLDVDG